MNEKFFDRDKLYHFAVCLLISFYSTEAAILASLAKEYGDKGNPYNHWCWLDLLADLLGIAAGTVIRLLVIRRWNWL